MSGWFLVAVIIVAVGVPAHVQATAFAEGALQPVYTGSHPGKNPPWFGLAAPDGRYEVLLADGCEAIGADMNVMLTRSDGSNEATWTLQLPESDQVCTVAEWHWMGNAPCETNPDGMCDVAYR